MLMLLDLEGGLPSAFPTRFRVLGLPGGPLAGVWVLVVREMRLLLNNRIRIQEIGNTGNIARGQRYRR